MARAIMITGTSSGAGKSVVTAGLLRLAADRGLSVAPFKAQNMALNSFVTLDGREIGRSQALQAMAARVEPDWRHNPILLKPESETSSQVIVRGRVVSTQSAHDYYRAHEDRVSIVRDAFDDLAARHDLIIMEGAGSPAEINLWDRDIVNMPMAEYAEARTYLVADIDRGGSFASVYGTWALFPEKWKALMGGYVLNMFRGDPSFLDSGTQEMERKTGLGCLGVVPMMRELYLPEEDSLARLDSSTPGSVVLSIGVIRTPYMANFTDFDPFLFEPDVALSYIHPSEPLDRYDVLILPGTKRTIHDIEILERYDMGSRLKKYKGTIVGICGGAQALGTTITDPTGIEAESGARVQGFGLLPYETEYQVEKVLRRVDERDPFYGQVLSGYEIHQGVSSFDGLFAGEPSCFGTYLHGLFDSDDFRHAFLTDACRRSSSKDHEFAGVYDIDAEIDSFARHLDQHLDVDQMLSR